MATREEQIDAVIALMTCPNCGEIREREYQFNGVKICRNCHDDACRGFGRRIYRKQDK